MSGIAGIFSRTGSPIGRSQIGEMTSALAHRGRDGSGIWANGEIGLGHVLLHTTSESLHENLPWFEHNCCITADARIDNRDELISQLGFSQPESGITDPQILLRAYLKWGLEFAGKILGDFALAIWDGNKHELICARDIFGVKPLYYFESKEWFLLGSEMKAILACPHVSDLLNETWMAEFLSQSEAIQQDKTQTFYQNIYRLLPAHLLSVHAQGQSMRRYWSLDPQRSIVMRSEDEYAEALQHHFKQAVKARMRSAFPAGSTVSGGLDSSSIACMMRMLNAGNPSPVHTFSAVYKEAPDADESEYINAVVQQDGFCPHILYPDRQGTFIELEKVLWHMDEPFYGTNYFMPWMVFRAAEEAGVRVLMDGTDGDTTISHGMDFLKSLVQNSEWRRFSHEAKSMTARFNNPRLANTRDILYLYGTPQLAQWARKGQLIKFARGVKQVHSEFNISTRKLVVNWGVKPFIPQPALRSWKRLRSKKMPVPNAPEMITPRLKSRISNRRPDSRANGSQPGSAAWQARQIHYDTLNSGKITYAIEWLNRMASAFSIDLRFPFCDRNLVEFCLAIPADQKLQDGWTRFVFRNAMKNILPDIVRWRGGKTSLNSVFPYMMKRFEGDFVQEILNHPPAVLTNYINLDVIRSLYDSFNNTGRPAYMDWVWQTVVLAVWLKNQKFSTS